MKKITTLIAMLIWINAIAQPVIDIFEKDHGISRKSRKGYLGQVIAHPENNTFELIYVLKPTSKKIPYEIYTFDKELNLIDTKKEEDELEKVKKRFKWFKYKGEDFEKRTYSARANAKAELVLVEKIVKFKWSWLRGGYTVKVRKGDKVKPKNDDGSKYEFLGGFYENDEEGYLLVPVYERGTNRTKAKILKCDGVQDVTTESTFNLAKGRRIVFSGVLEGTDKTIEEKNEYNDWVVVFAADNEGDDKENKYTYLRISANGKIKEQKEFESKNAPWRIVGAMQSNGQVYLYGPSIDKDKYNFKVLSSLVPTTTADETGQDMVKNSGGSLFGQIKAITSGEMLTVTQESIDERLDDMKFTNFQIARVGANGVEFVNNPSVKEINDKNIKPAGQKNAAEFDGKKFETRNAYVLPDKSFIVNGQDFKKDTKGKDKGTKYYRGMFLLHFDANGNFLRNYGVEIDQKKSGSWFSGGGLKPDMFPSSSLFIESTDRNRLYWMIGECKAIDTDTDIESDYNFLTNTQTVSITTSQNGLYTVQYGAIDIKTGALTEFKVLGDDEKRNYYLYPDNNYIRLNNFSIFISETKKGDRLLFSRFDLSK